MLTRRALVVSSLAAGACTTAQPMAGGAEPADARFSGLATLSESVHSGVASEDGQQRITVRLCRYPELGLAWIWMHARVGGAFYSFVDHLAPCGRDATPSDVPAAIYADLGRSAVFERRGAVNAPTSCAVSGAVKARRSAESRFGPGDREVAFSIRFTPQRLYSGLNPGRTEVFGRSRAEVTVGGNAHIIEGPAQFHEQRQTTERFNRPFCYMTLWGADAASTMLIAPARRDGYLLEGAKSTEVETVSVDPPGPTRRTMRVKLADGRELQGEAQVMQPYTLPIYGNTWRGHMIRIELGGRTYLGNINDYIIDPGVPFQG